MAMETSVRQYSERQGASLPFDVGANDNEGKLSCLVGLLKVHRVDDSLPHLARAHETPTTRPTILHRPARPAHLCTNVAYCSATRGSPTGASTPKVLLTTDEESRELDIAIVLGSGWLQDPTWCYSVTHTNPFLFDPDQREIVPSHWKIGDDTLNALRSRLHTGQNTGTANEESSKRLTFTVNDSCPYVYIKVHSLGSDTLSYTASGQAVHWESEQGWFDELIPISRDVMLIKGIGGGFWIVDKLVVSMRRAFRTVISILTSVNATPGKNGTHPKP
ncbi:uncharacterized protein EDB91DRAFT_1081827 [Suillus paluster]|uniref:uncharacterized protein n=1 Tax=Suillus paluster TaxID=48578 RepID=UPI001B85E165|nr:uncharacterized protein EDB91DRAFT_1081827 [Suillus paluster]KAG1741568.1 hypothetical protein EDB91DRAFT_1081827 [Suillus paluster]